MIKIIAAIGKNRELGKDGELLFRIKEDLQFFKDQTSGHAIFMGRKTWDSLPGKLPNREHYVLTRHPEDLPSSVHPVSDLKSFLDSWPKDQDLFIIGGGTVYWQTFKFADQLILTEINAEKPADTFFPEFDPQDYQKTVLKTGQDHGVNFQIVQYNKIKE